MALCLLGTATYSFIHFDSFESWRIDTSLYENWQIAELLTIASVVLLIGMMLAARHIFVQKMSHTNLEKAASVLADPATSQLQQEKMSALGSVAGGMAHEISNALQPAIGLGELVRDGLKQNGNKDHYDYMNIILGSAMHAQAIVESILNFTREKDIEFSEHDAFEVLSDSIEFAMSLLPSMIVLDISSQKEATDEPLTLECNKTSLMQIFVNILKNAEHAMGGQGEVHICVERCSMPDKPSQAALSISIQDWGAGMSEEVASKIFYPFFTTKDVSEGTGLGLATVQGLVLSHNGQISVSSELGYGTVFTLYFPVKLNKEDSHQGR